MWGKNCEFLCIWKDSGQLIISASDDALSAYKVGGNLSK